MFVLSRFFNSRRFSGDNNSINSDWEHTTYKDLLYDWLIDFSNYLDLNYKPFGNEEEFWTDLDEFGVPLENPKDTYFPSKVNIQKGDLGEAICSFLLENNFNMEVPVLPWARKISKNKALSNFDLICYNYNNQEIDNFIICTVKCNPKLKNLRSNISNASKEFKNLNFYKIISKLKLYYRAFQNELDNDLLNHIISNHLKGKRNVIKIIGFFISSLRANHINCATKFSDLNPLIPVKKNIIRHHFIRAALKFFFRGINK